MLLSLYMILLEITITIVLHLNYHCEIMTKGRPQVSPTLYIDPSLRSDDRDCFFFFPFFLSNTINEAGITSTVNTEDTSSPNIIVYASGAQRLPPLIPIGTSPITVVTIPTIIGLSLATEAVLTASRFPYLLSLIHLYSLIILYHY